MKKLREILPEGAVIHFPGNFRTTKPSPDLLSHQKISSELSNVVNKDYDRWHHDDLRIKNSLSHSIESIAHHIAFSAKDFYDDTNHDDYNRRKGIANQHYRDNKASIDTHISDTLSNLDKLHNRATTGKFVSDRERLKSISDIQNAKEHWARVRNYLNGRI